MPPKLTPVPGPADADPLADTERWLAEVVVGQGFCPFAARPYADDEVYLERADGPAPAVLTRFVRRAAQMTEHPSPATALLVLTAPAFDDFDVYLDLAETAAGVLEEVAADELTLATFHPTYRFAGLPAGDIAHHIHRSPWPLLHLLRAREVAEAARHHPDVAGIPAANRARASRLGVAFFRSRASRA